MSEAPETGIEESDPNADSRDGLAGDMGVSSGRLGTIRGGEEKVTYTAAATHPEEDEPQDGEVPPEQSSTDDRPEVNPASVPRHESDPDDHPGHGI